MASLIIKGKIEAKRTGKYDNKEFASLQFFVRDDRGAFQLVEVNLPDNEDHSAYVEGKQVEILVSVSYSKKSNKLYYRAVSPKTAAAA